VEVHNQQLCKIGLVKSCLEMGTYWTGSLKNFFVASRYSSFSGSFLSKMQRMSLFSSPDATIEAKNVKIVDRKFLGISNYSIIVII